MTNLKAIQTAFRPGRETTDPDRFSGRIALIEAGCALLAARHHIFLIGRRGIGKTSVARQLAQIATGDTRLLARVNSAWAAESFAFQMSFLTSDDSIRNINGLLYRLMSDQGGLAQWDDRAVSDYDLKGALDPRLVSEFQSRLRSCAAASVGGLALFIDEFERIPDRLGFSSLVKSAPDNCVFVVTGAARTERDLVQDHQSIARQLSIGKLQVDRMSDDELRLVVSAAEQEIQPDLIFEKSARERLIEVSDGHPYLLHLVGHATLTRSYRDATHVVTRNSVEAALDDVASHGSFLEDRYMRAIGTSRFRETVLRVVAESEFSAVPLSVVESTSALRGVSSAGAVVTELMSAACGAELEQAPAESCRFSDPLLKAYVRSTPTRLSDGPDVEAAAEPVSHKNRFSILHLSDIHYGGCHFFSSLPTTKDHIPEADRPSLERSLLRALDLRDLGPPPDLLVISGDLTQMAQTSEFVQARRLIDALRPRVEARVTPGESADRVIVVPGNHDVNWGIAKADPENRGMAFAPYTQFSQEIGRRFDLGVSPERLCFVRDFRPDLPLIVAAMNSNVLEGPDDHRGYVGDSQIETVVGEFDRLDGDRLCVRLVVMHHHLVPVSSIEAALDEPTMVVRDAARVKAALLSAGVAAVIHGHRHHAHSELCGDGRAELVIIGGGSVGTIGAERGEEPLSFGRITFIPHTDGLRISIERALSTKVRHISAKV